MRKKKILIVEDEEQLVNMLKARLEANNYEVLTAFDGQEALDAARREKPDLIILDLMLPKIDGYKVCALLKADKKYNEIPIIVLTARAQDEDVRLGREIGADAYIIKPFEPQMFLEKIEKLLKNKPVS